jgi:hypothetical protein
MENQPIKIRFSYTLDDLREATRNHTVGRGKSSKGSGIFGCLLFLAAICLWAVLMNHSAHLRNRPKPARLVTESSDLWLMLLPAVLPTGLLFMITIANLAAGDTTVGNMTWINQSKRSRAIYQITFAVICIILWIAVCLLLNPAFSVPWSPSRLELFVANFAPWALILCWLIVFARLKRERTLQRLWVLRPSLRQPKEVEFDANGVTLIDMLCSSRFRWGYCGSYSETANLIRIHLEDGRTIPIPKRAIADDQLVQLRGMIHDHIPHGSFLATNPSFPVITPQPVIAVAQEPPPIPSDTPEAELLEPFDEASPSNTA